MDLLTAAEKNKLPEFIVALEGGADIEAKDNFGNTALNWACEAGNADMVKLLLDKGANVHNVGGADKTPIKNAAFAGFYGIIRMLINKGAEIDKDLIQSVQLKVNILKENAQAGMVNPQAVKSGEQFLKFLHLMTWAKDLPEIIDSVDSEDERTKYNALSALEKLAQQGIDIGDAVPKLKTILKDGEKKDRGYAAASLSAYAARQSNWDELSELIKDKDADNVLATMSILVSASQGGADLTPVLADIIGLLTHENEDVRHDTPVILGHLATAGWDVSSAFEAVLPIMEESHPDLRKIACWCLYRMAKYGKIDISKALPRVKELAEEADENVSGMAKEVLSVV